MYHIQKAEFIRNGNRDGRDYAQIEVQLEGFIQPFSVLLQKRGEEIVLYQILQNNADYEIDWYDNDLHQAFIDRTSQLIDNSESYAPDSKEAFIKKLLDFGDIKEKLEDHLQVKKVP